MTKNTHRRTLLETVIAAFPLAADEFGPVRMRLRAGDSLFAPQNAPHPRSYVGHAVGQVAWRAVLAIALVACTEAGLAQSANEFHRILKLTSNDPVSLDVELSEGDLQIFYGREEQVSITTSAKVSAATRVNQDLLASALTVRQDGNHLTIRQLPRAGETEGEIRVAYEIDVPYRTEVRSVVGKGKQTITGIMGPVKAVTNRGDIKVSYISKGLLAQAIAGNLDLEVIGEGVEAKTGNGNISCVRLVEGARAETEDGDIVLMVVGPSTATVKKGTGRIDVGGAQGSVTGSTDHGDIHVKAMPHNDWHLRSASGNIRVELPRAAKFEVDATTDSGELRINRDDVERQNVEVRHLQQKVNGGGNYIKLHSESGTIEIN